MKRLDIIEPELRLFSTVIESSNLADNLLQVTTYTEALEVEKRLLRVEEDDDPMEGACSGEQVIEFGNNRT